MVVILEEGLGVSRMSLALKHHQGCTGFRGFQRFLEVFRGFQRVFDVFRGFQRSFRDPLRGRFPSQRLSVLLPLFLLPLNLSPI